MAGKRTAVRKDDVFQFSMRRSDIPRFRAPWYLTECVAAAQKNGGIDARVGTVLKYLHKLLLGGRWVCVLIYLL